METINLSDAALSLFRLRLVEDREEVTEANRPLFRELIAAGLMYPVSDFTRGPEANFRLTEEGWARRHESSAAAAPPAGSPEEVMPQSTPLSESALALFRLHVERMGKIVVDASNHAAYRELEAAGLVREAARSLGSHATT